MLPSVSEILGQTLHTYRKNTGYFLRFMVLFFVITFLLGLGQDAIFSSRLIPIPGLAFVVYLISAIAIGLATLWLHLALIVVSKNALDNQPLQSFSVAMKKVWPFLPRAAFAAIVSSVLVGVGGLFLVIPGLLFLIWYSFTSHEVIFFNAAAFPSLEESKRLVVGRWFSVAWRLFAPIFILALVANVLEMIVLAPFSWPHLLNPPYTFPVLFTNAFVIAVLYAIIFPMITMVTVIVFFALKNEPVSSPALQPPVAPPIAM